MERSDNPRPDEADILDHYLGVPGIESWFTERKQQRDLELAQRLAEQQQKEMHEQLEKKMKADRLAAIRKAMGSLSSEPVNQPTSGNPLGPTGPQRTEAPRPFEPTLPT